MCTSRGRLRGGAGGGVGGGVRCLVTAKPSACGSVDPRMNRAEWRAVLSWRGGVLETTSPPAPQIPALVDQGRLVLYVAPPLATHPKHPTRGPQSHLSCLESPTAALTVVVVTAVLSRRAEPAACDSTEPGLPVAREAAACAGAQITRRGWPPQFLMKFPTSASS